MSLADIAGWIIAGYILVAALLMNDRIAMRVVNILHDLYKQANEIQNSKGD